MDNRFQLGFSGNSCSFHSYGNLNKDRADVEHLMDTTLSLDSPCASSLHGSSTKGNKRKRSIVDGTEITEENFSLVLGLGRPSSSSDNSKLSSTTVFTLSSAKETDEDTSMDLDLSFQLHLESDNTPIPKRPAIDTEKKLETTTKCDLQLSLSTGPSMSLVTTSTSPVLSHQEGCLEISDLFNASVPADDGSTSSRWKSGGLLSQYVNSSQPAGNITINQTIPAAIETASSLPIIPFHATPAQKNFPSHYRCNNSTKTCLFQGCEKRARGASGLCIGHGGGRRCQREGCNKGAEGRTVYCKAHGGGRRCEFLGCTKSAEGRTDFCIAHGGGERCGREDCTRAARGKTGFCIKHGGGKRCRHEGCSRSAEGFTGLCISHGGGRRCQYPYCTKGAQGSTMFCKAHGGGKRCTFLGCNKGAEGSTPFCKRHGGGKRCSFQGDDGACQKSVHGGTNFCVRHGGGKRCAVPNCTSSARGSTAYCVIHGGGKRCKHDGCTKSAQSSTDFCKAHGGGKRCSWGQVISVLGVEGSPCDRYPRSKNGLCAAHNALLEDHKVHGGGTLGLDATQTTPFPVLDSVFEMGKEVNISANKDQRKSCISRNGLDHQPQSTSTIISEGRVHGGSLMAMLASNVGALNNSDGHAEVGPSGQATVHIIHHKWI